MGIHIYPPVYEAAIKNVGENGKELPFCHSLGKTKLINMFCRDKGSGRAGLTFLMRQEQQDH